MNRQKIIIFAVIGLLLIGVVWMFIHAASSDSSKADEGVNLSAEVPKEFTYKDMMAANAQNRNSYNYRQEKGADETDENINNNEDDYYSQQNVEDIKRIQQQIIENNNDQSYYQSVPASKPTPVKELPTEVKTENPGNIPEETQVSKKEENGTETKKQPKKRSRFFSVNMNDKSIANSIKAMVYGDQEVTDGATLKMRVNEDCITDDGLKIAKNTPVWGTVSIQSERIQVNIQSIKIGSNIYPFKKKVFGSDAIEGIYIPGNFKAETKQEAVGEGIDNLDIPVHGTGIIGDVVGSVLQAGKNAVSRNVRKTKVLIKTNYEIFLK